MARSITDAPVAGERRLTMTYDEFLAWEENVHAEWVDGEVTVFMPPSELHQDIVWFLSTLLGWYARVLGLGKVMLAPFEMRLLPGQSSREPDLLFVAREHADRLIGTRLEGPADLVIEVISESSVTRDRRQKLLEYEAAGVPEYWLFDARLHHRGSEFFQRSAVGRFEAISLDADGRYHSRALPGFWFRPDWLWQDPMPDPLALLATIAPDAVRTALGHAATGDG